MLSREEIRQIFQDTRPPKDPSFYREFDYLQESRAAFENYILDKTELPFFSIEIEPSSTIAGHYENRLAAPDLRCIVFRREKHRWEERVSVAQALGELIIDMLFASIPPGAREHAIPFFVEKLLLMLSERKLQAVCTPSRVMREKYTLTPEEISEEIRIRYPDYDSRSLNAGLQGDMLTVFHNIFLERSDDHPAEGMLSSDVRLISEYIRRKARAAGVTGHEDLMIGIRPLKGNDKTPRGRLQYALPVYDDVDCTILYPSLLAIERHDINRGKKDVDFDKWSTLRLILAHELGHAGCHLIPGKYVDFDTNPRKPHRKQESEATYFARLLLERRELLYNNMDQNAVAYKTACQKIKALIRFRYQGEPWLDWVLDPDHDLAPSYP